MKAASPALLALVLILSACSSERPAPPDSRAIPQTDDRTSTARTPQLMQVPQADVEPGLNILDIPGKTAPGYKNAYPAGTYAHFVAKPKYPKTLEVYYNDALLPRLTKDNAKIVICIPQQRGRLYIDNDVAMDWPVSTGTYGHETPTGVFRIMEKDEDHKSNRYGRFINGSGKVTNTNADLSKGLPDGHTFRAASMPYWLRLTPDGVGIHAGKVIAGRRLSHGCIRTPRAAAAKLYQYAVLDLPVYISRAVEDYNRGGYVKPIDVKYRPKPGNDYTDMPVTQTKLQ